MSTAFVRIVLAMVMMVMLAVVVTSAARPALTSRTRGFRPRAVTG